MSEDLEGAIGPDRRTFVKRLVVGTAFAAPVVSSFTMTGVKAVFGSVPGAVTAGANTTNPPPPEGFTDEIVCVVLDKGNFADEFNETYNDGGVSLNLVVPALALPLGTNICIYKGDLTALAALFPANQPPQSAYAVVWDTGGDPSDPDALSAITLNVSNAPGVDVGDPLYELDKSTGQPVAAGAATAAGAWSQSFTVDPGLVATDAPPEATTPGQAANPVVAQATTTG